MPELTGRVRAVVCDADTGRLNVVPDAPAVGTKLRLNGTSGKRSAVARFLAAAGTGEALRLHREVSHLLQRDVPDEDTDLVIQLTADCAQLRRQ
ncbi:hypothetical protein ACFQ2B_00485 [Streptomyces stramineus]